MIISAFLFIVAACGLLAVSSGKHGRQVFGIALADGVSLLCKICGIFILTAAAFCLVAEYGISVGVAVWFGFMSIGSFIQMLLLAYKPSWVRFLLLSAVLGIIVLFIAL